MGRSLFAPQHYVSFRFTTAWRNSDHALTSENNTEATKANTEKPEAFGLADEKRLVQKLDRTILPWIMLLYLLSYIDRSTMGNTRNIGLEADMVSPASSIRLPQLLSTLAQSYSAQLGP
ncbi:triacylglycerol lipase II precursor [Fusarium fujikuroi]|nr:triacylglycerol lipase II precursor [Fusarium fujikuroi]